MGSGRGASVREKNITRADAFLECQILRHNFDGRTEKGIATSLAFYRSQKGLSLENSEKSPKRGSRGLLAPGLKKLKKGRKKVEKGPKTRKKLENWKDRERQT